MVGAALSTLPDWRGPGTGSLSFHPSPTPFPFLSDLYAFIVAAIQPYHTFSASIYNQDTVLSPSSSIRGHRYVDILLQPLDSCRR
jgi:hypothetical protein